MKRKHELVYVLTLLMMVLSTASSAAFDHGTMIDIRLPYDIDSLKTASSLTLDGRFWLTSELYHTRRMPVWLADDTILYQGGIQKYFRVPADGGLTELILVNLDDYADDYDTFSESWSISDLPDFSDVSALIGTETLVYSKRDNSDIVSIEISDLTGNGESAVVIPGDPPVSGPEISNTGRYLAYQYHDSEHNTYRLVVRDRVSETDTELDAGNFYGCCFTPDDRSLIYSKSVTGTNIQLFSVPIEGGVPEQLTSPGYGDTGFSRQYPCMHPDGDLLIYTDVPVNSSNDAIVIRDEETGNERTVYFHPKQIRVLNLLTGESAELLPTDPKPGNTLLETYGYFTSSDGVFSPSGTEICYTGHDYANIDYYDIFLNENLYIIGFDKDAFLRMTTPLIAGESGPEPFPAITNYPNPFNPETTISFTVPEAGRVQIDIFSSSGQLVRTLIDSQLDAGTHAAVWDGLDNHNMPVSSGIYVARFISGENVVTDRMTLVK